MAKVDTSSFRSFDQIGTRLDEIVSLVRDKDVSLERSLDLFDEAIALGSKAVSMVDSTDFSPQEKERLESSQEGETQEADAVEAGSAEASTAKAHGKSATNAEASNQASAQSSTLEPHV